MPRGREQAERATEADVASVIDDARRGDEAAWRRLVEAYYPRLVALGRSNGFDPDHAEEIAQDVMVTVAEKIGGGAYEEQGRFEPWLFRIAMNRVRDAGRRRTRTPSRSLEDAPPGVEAPGRRDAPGDDERRLLGEAIAALAEADQQVIRLRHHAGMAFKAIADLLGEPVGTVLARHHRALRKLRESLERLESTVERQTRSDT